MEMEQGIINPSIPSVKTVEHFKELNKIPKKDSSIQRKKVLIVLPNHRWAGDGYYTMWLIFPTQVCLLAAQIEERYDVKIVDCIIDDLSKEEFAEIVKKEKPDLVGVSNFTHEYSKAGHTAVNIVKSINPSIK